MYISPSTKDNQELRQCLSYFFPVYSYSSLENQNRVQKVGFCGDYVETSDTICDQIFISTFDLAVRMREDLDEDQEMITLHQFGLLMLDWTNPQKAAEM
jgi:condensin complex subunit 3